MLVDLNEEDSGIRSCFRLPSSVAWLEIGGQVAFPADDPERTGKTVVSILVGQFPAPSDRFDCSDGLHVTSDGGLWYVVRFARGESAEVLAELIADAARDIVAIQESDTRF